MCMPSNVFSSNRSPSPVTRSSQLAAWAAAKMRSSSGVAADLRRGAGHSDRCGLSHHERGEQMYMSGTESEFGTQFFPDFI